MTARYSLFPRWFYDPPPLPFSTSFDPGFLIPVSDVEDFCFFLDSLMIFSISFMLLTSHSTSVLVLLFVLVYLYADADMVFGLIGIEI